MAETLTMKMLQEQINELRNELASIKGNSNTEKSRLVPNGLTIGDTFELADLTWKIIDISDNGYKCLADRLADDMKFDKKSNDWRTSALREYLNGKFYEKLVAVVGENNIVPFERDLLSLDGQTEYGVCEDKVSLLTFDEYREHRELIPNAGYWWWLITPDSTPCNNDSTWVRVVSPSGDVDCGICDYCLGVRPVVSFSSAIFESEDK